MGANRQQLTEKKQQRSDLQLSERLTCLGIMGDQLRAPLKSPVQHITIKLKSDCIYHFPIDFGKANGHYPFAVPNQSENGKYNLILV